jgi:hypothetical protein
MRAQAIEKILRLIMEETDAERLANLKTKAHIILDREDNRAASVIREVMNERV